MNILFKTHHLYEWSCNTSILMNRCITTNNFLRILWHKVIYNIMLHFKLWFCAKLIQWMHKKCYFSYVEQLYKQPMYVCLPDGPSYGSHFSRQDTIEFSFQIHEISENIHYAERNKIYSFLDTSNWPNCAPVVAKRPLSGILINALNTLVKWVFKNYLICGHVHQIFAIWWLENGTNWWFLTIIWATDHGIHFIYGVYTG